MGKIMTRGFLFSLIFLGLMAPLSADTPKVSAQPPKSYEVEPLPDISIGNPEAIIKVIEYSSLTCHHCAQFHKNVLPILKEKYIDTGKMQLIFRHFPIDGYALKASAVVVTLPMVRQFSLVNKLFETQERWTNKNCLEALAHISGETLEACRKNLENKVLTDRVLMARLKAEREMKIDATPTFVINGRVVDYAPTLDEVEAMIKPYLETSNS